VCDWFPQLSARASAARCWQALQESEHSRERRERALHRAGLSLRPTKCSAAAARGVLYPLELRA